jgi:hypothetical protein
MVRSTAFASLAVLASFAVAPLATHAETANVVGGGGATMTGGSDDMRISYNTGGAGGGSVLVQSGRLARFAGSHGDGQLVEYLTPAPAGTGRTVWLIGGGDDAQVIADQKR